MYNPLLAPIALFIAAVFICPVSYGDPQEGARGQALDARQGAVVVAGDPAFYNLPLTVECRVRLLAKDGFNILVANQTKASSTHWELFTTPGDGVLHVYVPGRVPDHVHTAFPLADGEWHWVAMVAEPGRIRLFVDGRPCGWLSPPLRTWSVRWGSRARATVRWGRRSQSLSSLSRRPNGPSFKSLSTRIHKCGDV